MINANTIAKLATLVKEYNMNLDSWDLVLADKKATKIERHMGEGARLTRSGSYVVYTSASGKVLHIQAFKNDREIFIPADFTICDDEGNAIREHILAFQVVDIIRHGV